MKKKVLSEQERLRQKKVSKRILIFLGIPMLALCLFVFYLDSSVPNTNEDRIVVSEPIDLEMNIILNGSRYGLLVSGTTNLPDSTKLAVNLNVDGNTRGQTHAFVVFGKFEFNLSQKLINFNEIEISCYRNQFWQNKSVLKQLAFVNNMKKDECMTREFSMEELKDKYFSGLLNFNKTPNGVIDHEVEIKSADNAQIKRTAINLYVDKTINDDELEKCIKYCILKEIVKESNTKAIVVRCFHKGEDITFRSNAVFAPYGEWARANENVGFSEYKLKI